MQRASSLLLAFLVVAVACALCRSQVAADDHYPARPITMIVPFPAGGGVDAVARIIADRLATTLGQPIIIDNRGGAGGVIGTRAGAKAAPDGYTLIIGDSGTTAINPTLYANAGYDVHRDFATVGLIATTPIVLMAHPSLPAQSVAALVGLAKSEPGSLNFGTPPLGTLSYLATQLFKDEAGIDMTIVPYKGTAALTNDLVGGHVRVGFNVLAPALGGVQSGALRLIATAGRTRSALFPDVPTVIEQGLPDFEAELHYGLLVPAGTATDTIAQINSALLLAIGSTDVRARIIADGDDPHGSSPQDYASDIDRDAAKWSALIRRLNLRVE
jgi:tripartite-type tricarboxylate transporter receptor subunit TctC